ncbi:unnamed protein product [Albugo candida]|uniref:Uncharacterized protein n=1 Tax=Albugo candida TaxID=65357 RepID=A0A024GDU7_9STRA|nr:unnamed protein product [Albugo candida]|eukprot:CCI45046.1 unnamed protein product [Albugo candida]
MPQGLFYRSRLPGRHLTEIIASATGCLEPPWTQCNLKTNLFHLTISNICTDEQQQRSPNGGTWHQLVVIKKLGLRAQEADVLAARRPHESRGERKVSVDSSIIQQ